MVGLQPIKRQHGVEHRKGPSGKNGLVMGGENRGPGDVIPVGHFVEQLEGLGNETAFAVDIQKGVGEGAILDQSGFDDLRMELSSG